jgi:uncharacterized membrane protein YkvA (DUF1232 family)
MFGLSLWLLALVIVAAVLGGAAVLYAVVKQLEKREPYGTFIRLRTRQKIRFFRLLITDKRVPRRAKLLPLALIPYLASPIDIVPDFIPVLGYMDDVAIVLAVLALTIRFTPRPVIEDLFRLAAAESS